MRGESGKEERKKGVRTEREGRGKRESEERVRKKKKKVLGWSELTKERGRGRMKSEECEGRKGESKGQERETEDGQRGEER